MAKKLGRPSKYTPQVAKQICQRISDGESLRSICRDDKMPSMSMVFRWLLDEKYSSFREQYAQACDVRTEHLFEHLQEVSEKAFDDIVGDDKSDNARISARKLEVDTLKWILARMKPKKYGDKVDVTSGGETIKGNTIVVKDFS